MNFGAARVAPEKAVFRPALPMSFLPGIAEMHMATKMTYGEQLKHPNWQRKRLEMLNAAGWACTKCDCKDVTLHVHHRRYIKGRMAWEYSEDELEVLCEGCHAQEHADRELLQRLLDAAEVSGYGAPAAIGLVAGYIDGGCGLDQDLVDAALAVDGHHYDLGMLASIAAGSPWPQMSDAARTLTRCGVWSPPQENAVFRWEEQLDPVEHLQRLQLVQEMRRLEPESVPAVQGMLVGLRNGIVAGEGVPPKYVDSVLIDSPSARKGHVIGEIADTLLNDATLEEASALLSALRIGDAGRVAAALASAVEGWQAERLCTNEGAST